MIALHKGKRLLTISVDDGHPADLRVAEMLARFDLTATFYIPARNLEREVISPHQVRELASRFEIGSHTMNHVPLTDLSVSEAWNEIKQGKQWLEDTISAPARAFCYPRGKHNERLAAMARAAGFAGARTAMLNRTDVPRDAFRWGVSTQAHSHSPVVQIRHAIVEGNFAGLCTYASSFRFASQWPRHLAMAIAHVERHGGIVHFFLHGWEIAEEGQWATFEKVLRDLANRSHLQCVTNGHLFTGWQALKAQATDSSSVGPAADKRPYSQFRSRRFLQIDRDRK